MVDLLFKSLSLIIGANDMLPSGLPDLVRARSRAGHNCLGHDYLGHNYSGHNYLGHNYLGHNYLGP